MADSGTKMSSFQELSSSEKTYFFGEGEGRIAAIGRVAQGGEIVNRLIDPDDLKQNIPVTDVTVGGTSVLNNSVAEIDAIPSASSLAGTGLSESSGKLVISLPVPSPGTNEHRGDVLTVDNNDQPVWQAPHGSGGGSKSIIVVENPTIIDGILTITAQNNTIYDVVTPNGGYTDIKIIPPTVASGEVIDFYVNLQNNRDDGDTHYIEVENMQRITDDFENGIYSQLQDAAPVFIHCFYKYFTLKSISSE